MIRVTELMDIATAAPQRATVLGDRPPDDAAEQPGRKLNDVPAVLCYPRALLLNINSFSFRKENLKLDK